MLIGPNYLDSGNHSWLPPKDRIHNNILSFEDVWFLCGIEVFCVNRMLPSKKA